MKPITLAIVFLLAPSAFAEPDLLKKPVTIEERSHAVGDRHQIKVDQETKVAWKAKNESQSVSRGGKNDYELTVAAVDDKQRVSKVVLRQLDKKGDLTEQRIVRGRTKTPGYHFAKQLLQRRSVVNLFGLKGSLKPGQAVKLRKKLWDALVLNGSISEQSAHYVGVEKGSGLAVLKVRYVVTEPLVLFKGCTTRSVWTGTIAFDPKGPRLRRVALDAEVEVFLPPGKPGKATGTGRIRWTREVTAAKDRKKRRKTF